jgi:hypothetical protein
MTVTNTLAYFSAASVTKKKVFKRLAPGRTQRSAFLEMQAEKRKAHETVFTKIL